MAYKPHTLLVIGGTLNFASTDFGAKKDIWSCGIRLADSASNGPLGVGTSKNSALNTVLTAWYAATASCMASTSTLDYFKLNDIGADGKYLDPGSANTFDTTDTAGGLGPQVPGFLSLAVSFRTAKTRGPGSHGRIYLPNYTFSSSGTVFVSSANRLSMDTSVHNLLSNIVTAIPSAVPVVASSVNATNTPIIGTRTGATYDVQRRRKNAFPESYLVTNWPG